MKKPNLKNLEAIAEQWNRTHPIGTRVMRYKLINPLREPAETKTSSEAWVMGGHSVMVMVDGVSGGVLLESVRETPCDACGGNGGRVSENSGQIPYHCQACDETGVSIPSNTQIKHPSQGTP
jgi:hypothetical protein